MKHGETELTPEQLQMAFRHLRRPGRPATLEEALRDPLLSPAIKGLARQLSRVPLRSGQQPPATLPGAPPVPATPTQPPLRRQGAAGVALPPRRRGPNKPKVVDCKRAAANDRDD